MTGNQGRGAGAGRKARAVGVGVDADAQRVADLADWLEPHYADDSTAAIDTVRAGARARILAELQAARSVGDKLLTIGARAARRQARRLVELRGVTASETSVSDAAADAVHGVLVSVRRLDKLTPDQWAAPRVLRVLAMYAGRAAFLSLCRWSVAGMTGDNTFERGRGLVEVTPDIAEHEANPDAWADHFTARRAAARWVFDVGLRRFAAGLPASQGKAAAVKAARARCHVVGRVIMGASIADACSAAGFATVKNWVESCKRVGFFESLRAARAASASDCAAVELARVSARSYALQAAAAARALRSLPGSAWRTDDTSTQRGRAVASMARARAALPRRALIAKLRGAVAWAQWHRARGNAALAANLAEFDTLMAGLHSDKWGNLRRAMGFVDAKGRESSKLNPAGIRAARGKLPRRSPLAPSVVVEVKDARRRAGVRKLACAPLAP